MASTAAAPTLLPACRDGEVPDAPQGPGGGPVLGTHDEQGRRPSRAEVARQEFEAFFNAHHRELGRLAYTLTGDHAEADDIAAEALASAWQRWDRVTAADHPLAYVRRSVVNISVSRVRRRVRERRGRLLLHPLARTDHLGPDVGLRLDLERAVLALPPRRRACVVLRHVFDLSAEEVARTLGISEGAVKSQTSKGLGQLRTLLDRASLDGGEGPGSTDGAGGGR
jgi:RNA polymerase sigma-70 factor (sigma-E family)